MWIAAALVSPDVLQSKSENEWAISLYWWCLLSCEVLQLMVLVILYYTL